MITLGVVLLLSYLVGAIPWSWLVVRLARGVDLRQVGSGNLGATNTFRTVGTAGGLLVLVLDILKGWVAPAVFARWRFDSPLVDAGLLATLAGAAAIVGHIYPVYLGFRGGKGIATTAGVFLALEPLALAAAFAAFAIALAVTRGIVSVGSLVSSLVLPFAILFVEMRRDTAAWDRVALGAALAVLIWYKHIPNLGRLLRGEEKSAFARSSPGPKRSVQP